MFNICPVTRNHVQVQLTLSNLVKRTMSLIHFIFKRTQQCTHFNLGKVCQTQFEKTIMLVGETGSGKSTLVDGILNYLFDVNFEDPFRFKIVVLEKEEQKTTNQVST